jgi:probable HAF family extracellular repeat protein
MKTRRFRNFLIGLVGTVVIAVGLTLFTTATATTPSYYAVTNLGTLGGSNSYAFGINDTGQVVGEAETSSGNSHAFLWKEGAMTDLDPLNSGNSFAIDINNRGQVLSNFGSHGSTTPSGSGFLWSNGTITNFSIHDYGSDDSIWPLGINDVGQVAGGFIVIGTPYIHACLLKDGNQTDLHTEFNFDAGSIAYEINNSGQVVGNVDFTVEIDGGVVPSNDYHAFFWKDGTMTDLGTLGGSNSDASDINNKGQVVGEAKTSSDTSHAFLWKDSTMIDLGTLDGYSNSFAFGINNKGQVVGKAETSSGTSRAFFWKDGTMTDLNSLIPANSGWELTEAQSINKNGQIVGTGKFNGQTNAFLLTPVWLIN